MTERLQFWVKQSAVFKEIVFYLFILYRLYRLIHLSRSQGYGDNFFLKI